MPDVSPSTCTWCGQKIWLVRVRILTGSRSKRVTAMAWRANTPNPSTCLPNHRHTPTPKEN